MRSVLSTTVLLMFIFFILPAMAQQKVKSIEQEGVKRTAEGREAQQQVDVLNSDTRVLVDEYYAHLKLVEGLRQYNLMLKKQLDSQRVEVTTLEKSIGDVALVERQILPLMLRMIDGLDQSVALDVPFLMEERTKRVNVLKDTMERSDVSVAEKFRKVMEAYQIENEYGTSSETYTQTITKDGVTRSYNMLRVGRIGLYYQSDDAKITGRWDNELRDWVEDDSARSEIRKGIRIAKQLIAPELIVIPVAAPAEAE